MHKLAQGLDETGRAAAHANELSRHKLRTLNNVIHSINGLLSPFLQHFANRSLYSSTGAGDNLARLGARLASQGCDSSLRTSSIAKAYVARNNERVAQRGYAAAHGGSRALALRPHLVAAVRQLVDAAVAANANAAHMEGAHGGGIAVNNRAALSHQWQTLLPKGDIRGRAAHVQRNAVHSGRGQGFNAEHRCRRPGKHCLHRLLDSSL